MKKITTEVLVIGGGATGTGVIRDLSMRGLKCVLLERRDLSDGTTGRYHGLLHSGGRYAVKDPLAAKECIEENAVLRRIIPQCIEDTGGFFVVTSWDDPEYVVQFMNGCNLAGIPCEEVSHKQMLREEPNLNPRISACLRVPDASADSFLASELNAESAKIHGAQIFTYHEVKKLLCENNRVIGVVCHDLVKDEELHIFADIVVLAAGAWSGKLASTIDIQIQILPGKGTMIAVNHRIVNTVINRCKMPSDGDILVPIHSVSVMGTTDVRVLDPDRYSIDPWEIRLMLEEGEKIIPGFRKTRILRAWAGVRPLYQETSVSYNRELSRAYVLLDHSLRDGIEGLVTITSGKWTTYRKMAQVTSDLVCEKLGVDRACRTHLEPISTSSQHYHYVGIPLDKVEKHQSYGSLICECELATYEDVVDSILRKDVNTIDDIRRDIRLGMGPCQGAFCTYRVTGILHKIRQLPVEDANNMLHDFLGERWKGLLPVLWGSQLRQERLNELIYLNVLNIHRLPGLESTRLGPNLYELPEVAQEIGIEEGISEALDVTDGQHSLSAAGQIVDLLIIGGGFAGLTIALFASLNNLRTKLITKGWGSLFWEAGCVDLLGYSYDHKSQVITSPLKSIGELVNQNPAHPYALVGLDTINESLEFIKGYSKETNYPFEGTINDNWMIPTAAGSIHPTCLAPLTMIAGDLRNRDPMLIIGIEGFNDFYPGLVSANLNSIGHITNHKMIKISSLDQKRLVNSITLARLFEKEEFRDEIVRAIKPLIGRVGRIGLPAILGINKSLEIFNELQEKLEIPIFEIPGLPPSIPGLRLHNFLVKQIFLHGGQVHEGMEVFKKDSDGQNITTVYSEAAARIKPHISKNVILATGGILGGGLRVNDRREIQETALGLLINYIHDSNRWLHQGFFSEEGHPIFDIGVNVNHEFQPVNESGGVHYKNLYAVGSILGKCDPVRELSTGGIALTTAYKIGKLLSTHPR